jgi:peroxiredoxin
MERQASTLDSGVRMYSLLLFAALLQNPALAEYRLLSGCSNDDPVVATIGADTSIRVRFAMAGGSAACYAVTAAIRGNPVEGFILGGGLPAIAAFEQERKAAVPIILAAPAETQTAKTVLAAPLLAAPRNLPYFDDFSGLDAVGKRFSLARLRGKAILVCFWSPGSRASRHELTSLVPLYDEFHNSGLDAVGIGLDSNANRILRSLDESGVTWPQIPDRLGLARKYQVDPTAPTTFLLDRDRRIRGVGLRGNELAAAVKELLK